jgi:hypothetical protein
MRARRYAMSEIRKHANRVGFNVPEAEVHGGADHTKSLGMLGHAGMSGKVCLRCLALACALLRFALLAPPFLGLHMTRHRAGAHDSSKRKRKSQYWNAKAPWSYGQQRWWQWSNEWHQLNCRIQRAHRHGV